MTLKWQDVDSIFKKLNIKKSKFKTKRIDFENSDYISNYARQIITWAFKTKTSSIPGMIVYKTGIPILYIEWFETDKYQNNDGIYLQHPKSITVTSIKDLVQFLKSYTNYEV